MRALAILGPRATEPDLAPFHAAGAEIILTENLQQTAADVVLLLGGDGTVQRHLAAFVQAQTPLLVVPAGSANDFARALGLRTGSEALDAWRRFLAARDNIRQVDVGIVTFADDGARATNPAYFSCALGAGVDAAVAQRVNSLPRWLRANGGYFLAAIPALLHFQARRIAITATQAGGQQRTISEPGILAAAANAPWYGHGMRIAPQAELDDGLLEFCFVRQVGKLRLLRLFPKVYRGGHLGLPEVEYFRAERVCIESQEPLAVHADGEPLGQTPVEVTVARRALRVIVGST
ncbi:MAG TPA: diacylglycerol kinase family protein [Terriglobales bacterium]|nr:diacylglycerol kinase family protein [Terriglobales bacterium]